mmetsp:Transcript_26844/g.59101  ORF Transcript_26844/g.59101 Transcript_26844/m.59101 type:complete len:220 (-) Transcript_26844:131-790(-)
MPTLFASASAQSRSRSGRPTAISSTLSKHKPASANLPKPCKALALRYQALWSWSFNATALSAESSPSCHRPSLMAACAMFFKRVTCNSCSSRVSLTCQSATRNFLSTSSPCFQLWKASTAQPFFHSTSPSCLHFCPYSRATFRLWVSIKVPPCAKSSFLFCSAASSALLLAISSKTACMLAASAELPVSSLRRASSSWVLTSGCAKNSRNGRPIASDSL